MAESWYTMRDEVFADGLRGRVPRLPADPALLEEAARQYLPAGLFSFVAGGAGGGRTVAANRAAFDRWELTPRMMPAARPLRLRTELWGTGMSAPVVLAPIGLAGLAHPDGEAAAARVARDLGLAMTLSNSSSLSLEEVAGAAPGAGLWFQLHPPKDEELGASMVRRAEKAGYQAIVVTVDSWARGWRPADLDHGYDPFLRGQGMGTFLADPLFRRSLPADLAVGSEPWLAAAAARWREVFGHPGLSYAYFDRLREATGLPVLIKGVLHPDDAEQAIAHGVSGVVVSNHGGRQLDRSTAALDALPAVVRQVAGRVPVLFDSGVRSGADVAVALGLGADAVLLGRPWLYGLAIDGAEGVRHVLRCVLAELELTMLMSGAATVGDLRHMVAPAPGRADER
ncbi:alpha-hydroxy-acid oxidizing protein [Streptomyces iranensis]|uniref:FMN-dependent alpha-hydroxy acid dehydrogenase n=1 Tax=Streptomyces iranensis TaxID=576784 RepID=A0A061A776_9ACTN|nr:alpha-hydroxy-acid oxidizing protein [Streptomyces iranensis]MBP2067675.1 L-lactate dehydrogenase (cytochrome)/isopentenyl-diphosphate delta-isomerase [Streptomyces iranensis]CDR18234.1 FMN-dependent alpha-hydroxy acid dehydrogenase [Streptomyces iranensis]